MKNIICADKTVLNYEHVSKVYKGIHKSGGRFIAVSSVKSSVSAKVAFEDKDVKQVDKMHDAFMNAIIEDKHVFDFRENPKGNEND